MFFKILLLFFVIVRESDSFFLDLGGILSLIVMDICNKV